MEKKTDKIGFTLFRITSEQFAILEENFSEKGKISIQTSLRFGAEETQKLIGVYASFTFMSQQKPFIVIEAACHFMIHPDAWMVMCPIENNYLTVPRGFLSHLAMLTIGTTRGILHAKLEGTRFNQFLIPTINVLEIIKEDTVLSFKVTDKTIST